MLRDYVLNLRLTLPAAPDGESERRMRASAQAIAAAWGGGVVPGVRLELTTYRLPSHFGFRRPEVRGLDYPFTMAPRGAAGAARLVSTPSLRGPVPPGLARDRHGSRPGALAFPEFERFYSRRFHRGTRYQGGCSTN